MKKGGLALTVDTHKRSLLKAVVYKSGSVAVLALVSWLFTRDLVQMSYITIAYEIIAIVGYFVHERIWAHIKWGSGRAKE